MTSHTPNLVRLMDRERTGSRKNLRELYLKEKWRNATRLDSHDLLSHYGCVNAVEFSRDGNWMVSGGDDRRILVWNMDQALNGCGYKSVMDAEHRSNIFCLGFDNDGRRVYSGGNDEQVIVHDIETLQPLDYFLHEEPVYSLSVHPENPDLFATACSDGRVLLFDMRQNPSEDPLMIAGFSHAFHAVQFNPVEPRLLVAANQKHGIGLWDIRNPRSCALKYESRSSMHVRFNDAGTKLIGLRRRMPPILFNIESPVPVCEFDNPGYYNSCTMKSCSFGGPNDEFVLSGSDDFNLYMWRIPEDGDETSWQDRAHLVLQGHRSIVNQVRYNSQRSVIASSGVEKIVKFWSVHSFPQGEEKKMGEKRAVYTHEDYIGLVLRSETIVPSEFSQSQTTTENPRMMAFFDSLIQREIEGWDSQDDTESQSPPSEESNNSETSETGFSDFSTRANSFGSRRRRLMERISVSIADDLVREDRSIAEARNTVGDTLNSSHDSTDTSILDSSTLDTSAETIPSSGTASEDIREPPRNRIAELIERKRARLVKIAKRRGKRLRRLNERVVNQSLENARRMVRLSQNSRFGGNSSEDGDELEEQNLNLGLDPSQIIQTQSDGGSSAGRIELGETSTEPLDNNSSGDIRTNGFGGIGSSSSGETSRSLSGSEEASGSSSGGITGNLEDLLPGTSKSSNNLFINSLRQRRLRIVRDLSDEDET